MDEELMKDYDRIIRGGRQSGKSAALQSELRRKELASKVATAVGVLCDGSWDDFCQRVEDDFPEIRQFLGTWGPNCGASRDTFRGHLCRTLLDILVGTVEAGEMIRGSVEMRNAGEGVESK